MTRINKPNVLTRAYQKGMIHHPNLAKIWLYQISDLIYKQYPPFSVKIFSDILSADIICSKKRTVSKSKTWRTLNFEEQTMTKDKFLIIFCSERRLLCLLSFNYFLQHSLFWKLGNITWIFPSFGWGIFSHETRLEQKNLIRHDIRTVDKDYHRLVDGNGMNDTIKLWTL